MLLLLLDELEGFILVHKPVFELFCGGLGLSVDLVHLGEAAVHNHVT